MPMLDLPKKSRTDLLFAAVLAVLISFPACQADKPTASPTNPQASESGDASTPKQSFLAIGDWGSGDEDQKRVAKAMKTTCATQTCGFVLTLGDNFYDEGVASTTDPLWQSVYRDVYGSLGLPFYAILGNHDTEGNIQAQIDYSKTDSTWHMPGEYYSFTMPGGSTPPLMEIFVINSEDFDYKQQIWLSQALSKSTALWKLLAMHHPLISNGEHGDDDAGIKEELLPIICNRTSLILSGNDHIFSHLRSSIDGCWVEQLVIGNGGASLYEVSSDSRAVSSGSFFGFGRFEVTKEKIAFQMIQTDGTVYYSTSWAVPASSP